MGEPLENLEMKLRQRFEMVTLASEYEALERHRGVIVNALELAKAGLIDKFGQAPDGDGNYRVPTWHGDLYKKLEEERTEADKRLAEISNKLPSTSGMHSLLDLSFRQTVTDVDIYSQEETRKTVVDIQSNKRYLHRPQRNSIRTRILGLYFEIAERENIRRSDVIVTAGYLVGIDFIPGSTMERYSNLLKLMRDVSLLRADGMDKRQLINRITSDGERHYQLALSLYPPNPN